MDLEVNMQGNQALQKELSRYGALRIPEDVFLQEANAENLKIFDFQIAERFTLFTAIFFILYFNTSSNAIKIDIINYNSRFLKIIYKK